MSGMGLTLGSTRDNEIGEDGIIGLQSPADVPEVAAGYWWHPSMAVGLGGASFAVPEGNGHATFALAQVNPLNQPTLLTENGQQQFRMRRTADANPSRIGTLAAVSAGWTGATYVGMWLRLPDASGDITAAGSLFLHTAAAGFRRWASALSTTTSDRFGSSFSLDGTATSVTRWGSPFVGGGWVYCEHIFDPALTLGGATSNDRAVLFTNFALQTQLLVSAGPATIFDASSQIFVGCSSNTVSNTDTTDWAACYYANGIPSLGNRIALSRWRAPV